MLESGSGFGNGGRPPRLRKRMRNRRGNMLVLIMAILMGILMLLLGFSLSFVRLLGSSQEQKTAIEAAALAAARDVGRIVIEDPNFGFISISDAAPSTPNTKADDGYSMPVTGINTLLATIRLDLIIASTLSDTTMQTLAENDYNNAMAAKDFLVQSLEQAITPGGGGNPRDVDGNLVNPYQSAVDAYNQNVIRMAGGASRLVNGSMRIQLGCTTPSMTATPVPTPISDAAINPAQMTQSYYNSYTNIPFGGRNFVFAGIGKDIKLVDLKNFAADPGGLPYVIPTVLKVEADQLLQSAGAGGTNVVHSIACAQPAAIHDPRPAPGAMTLRYPNGRVAEILKPLDYLTNGNITGETMDLKTSTGGDSPPTGSGAVVPATVPPWGSSMPAPTSMSVGIYDWVRRAGTKPNIRAIQQMLNTPFSSGITNTVGGANVYTWNPNGSIKYVQVTGLTPSAITVSELQGRAVSHTLFTSSNGNNYSIEATDSSRQPGRMRGGRHGGEPLTDPVVNAAAGMSGMTIGGAPDDFGSDIASLGILLLFVGMSSGLFITGVNRNSKAIKNIAVFVMFTGATVSSAGLLTACGGGSPPPPVVVTSTVTGPRQNRPTYTQNGLVVDISFIKKP